MPATRSSVLLLLVLTFHLESSLCQFTTETHAGLFPDGGHPVNMKNASLGSTVTFTCVTYVNSQCVGPDHTCSDEANLLNVQWHIPSSPFSIEDGTSYTSNCSRRVDTLAIQVTQDEHKNSYQCSFQMNITHPCSTTKRGLKVFSRAAILTVASTSSQTPVSCDTTTNTPTTHVTEGPTVTTDIDPTQSTPDVDSATTASPLSATSAATIVIPAGLRGNNSNNTEGPTGSGVNLSPNSFLLSVLLVGMSLVSYFLTR